MDISHLDNPHLRREVSDSTKVIFIYDIDDFGEICVSHQDGSLIGNRVQDAQWFPGVGSETLQQPNR